MDCTCRKLGMDPLLCEQQCDHPGGSLNTTPDLLAPRIVPAPPLMELDDDTPLSGGACDLGGDCESCQ